jgi:outer membrane protein assembly factor BamB
MGLFRRLNRMSRRNENRIVPQAAVWLSIWAVLVLSLPAEAADWPQFMRDSQHTGDSAEEQLRMPLQLIAQVKLDDAIMTSPAVVGGRIYVVDQMGVAYCVDSQRGRIVWKSEPERDQSYGGNTSSPCVAAGKVIYGTVAGNLHILDATNGEVLRSITYGLPILGSISLANESIYFQTLDGVVHCLDLDGNKRRQWDYSRRSRESPTNRPPQYAGVAVVVSGTRVVMAVGFDLVCVDDLKTRAEHVWTRREIMGKTYLPVGLSIRNDHVYCALPGKDGLGIVARVSLLDGSCDKQQDVLHDQWAVMAPPAVRHSTVYFSRQAFGVTALRFGSDRAKLWTSFSDKAGELTPSLSAPALSKDHCVFTTLDGEFIAVKLTARGRGLAAAAEDVFRFATPDCGVVTSSPAISNGRVHFGCDDGYLYVLGNGEAIKPSDPIKPSKDGSAIERRRSNVVPVGENRYAWPSAFGGSRNANFVDDASIKPPFRVRWAARSGGLFKQPVCATEQDVISASLGGLVVCREQQTGRIRWRRKLPKQAWCRSAPLCVAGKVYVPRMHSLRYPKQRDKTGALYCLNGETGEVIWESPIGIGDRLRASPVFVDGVVAFGSYYPEGKTPTNPHVPTEVGQAVDAWDANTGRHLWQVVLKSSGEFLNGPAGCAGDGLLFFAGGSEGPRSSGESLAIVPQTGEIKWRTDKAFVSQTGTPSFQAGKVYLPGTYKLPLACLSAADGSIVWQHDAGRRHWFVDTVSIGPDYFTVNNKYKGGANRWNLDDGTLAGSANKRIQLWGPAHGCGSVVLTSNGLALSATIDGLCMVDSGSGKLLWKSAGFASYTCPHAIVSNGRIFYCPQTCGIMFCFEPENIPASK